MSAGRAQSGGGTLAVVTVGDDADRAAAYAIRQVVFVDEQHVPLELERDAGDEQAEHVLARVDGVPAATARVLAQAGGSVVVGRVAVLPAFRGRGIGRAVMAAVERRAADRDVHAVQLHAQLTAQGFYERLGYVQVSGEYDDAGIAHVTMSKRLPG
jgi:predicted GNAT family N-acyltransferase